MKMAMAIISVEETKKVMLESRNISRVTYLAFLVPLSFVTSFLGMNEELVRQSAMVYWVFFVIAVPLSIGAIVLAAYWNNIITRWEKLEEAVTKTKKQRSVTRPAAKTGKTA